MRRRSMGVAALFVALLLLLQTCKGRSGGGSGTPGPAFPEGFPAGWDGRTDYAASSFTIQ